MPNAAREQLEALIERMRAMTTEPPPVCVSLGPHAAHLAAFVAKTGYGVFAIKNDAEGLAASILASADRPGLC